MEEDKATINLIFMIRFHDMVQAGEDEATINLVNKLEAETKAEETQYNKEKDKMIKEKITKKCTTLSSSPKISKS